MTDNITLPRAVVEQARFAMKRRISRDGPLAHEGDIAALDALDAALAEPPAKPEPATDKQVKALYRANENGYWVDYRYGWKAAERFHGIRGSK